MSRPTRDDVEPHVLSPTMNTAGLQVVNLQHGDRTGQAGASDEKEGLSARDMALLQTMMAQVRMEMTAQLQPVLLQVSELAKRKEVASVAYQPGTPFAPGSPVNNRYSASAAMPLPPVVPHTHRQSVRRQSYSVAPTLSYSPLPPTTPLSSAQRPSDGTERAVNWNEPVVTDSRSELHNELLGAQPVRQTESERQWDRVSKAMNSIVKPFYGQASKDKDTVIDWVENVDTQFSIRMPDMEEGRLDLVRSLLAGTAQRWMNRRVQELKDQRSRGEYGGPIEWIALRQPFIDAHLGLNTIETFKAQLRSLRLGSVKCPSPVEFNKEFDHLAELAYPDRRGEAAMDSVLGDEYGTIIRASDPELWKQVMYTLDVSTLEQWKLKLSRRWAVHAQIVSLLKQQAKEKGNGGDQWRGGSSGKYKPSSASVAAITPNDSSDDTDTQYEAGEADTTEGEPDSQLRGANAARGGSGRGRGRGGRGGGSSRQPWSDEKKRLYDEKRCFTCHEKNHTAEQCPQKPSPKAKAGQ